MKDTPILAAAVLPTACGTLAGRTAPVPAAHEGGPANAVLERPGGPGPRRACTKGACLVCRTVDRGEVPCHAVHVLRGGEAASADPVGNRCERARTWTRVTVLATDLTGKPLVEAPKACGAPDFSDVEAGADRLACGLSRSQAGTSTLIGEGRVTGPVSLVPGGWRLRRERRAGRRPMPGTAGPEGLGMKRFRSGAGKRELARSRDRAGFAFHAAGPAVARAKALAFAVNRDFSFVKAGDFPAGCIKPLRECPVRPAAAAREDR